MSLTLFEIFARNDENDRVNAEPFLQLLLVNEEAEIFVTWNGATTIQLWKDNGDRTYSSVKFVNLKRIPDGFKDAVQIAREEVFAWRSLHCDSCHKPFSRLAIDGGRCSCGSMVCALSEKDK